MGNWFCDKKSVENRGLIFGLWTCHQYMGDITAGVCTAVVLGKFSFDNSFFDATIMYVTHTIRYITL